jgi:hypothetical protein
VAGSLSTFKPHFSDVIRATVDAMLLDMYFTLPAKIVKYNKDTQYADVEIQLYEKFIDGVLDLPPVIPMVPVKHPRANDGKAFIHMPLKPGDDVILVFSQRSLDNWKTQGGPSDPSDPRKHHITDAYALIGGSAIPDAFSPQTDDAIEIVNGTSRTIIHPDGTYNLYGGNTDDLVQVINDFILGVQRALTTTLIGPQPLVDDEDPGWTIIQERAQAFVNGSDPYEEI